MDSLGMNGWFDVTAFNPDGSVKASISHPNTVVADGKSVTASRIVSGTAAPGSFFDWIAIGEGSNAPDVTDADLTSEVYGRINASGTSTGSLAQYIGKFDISGAATIQEYGVFNANSAGSMLARSSGTALALTSGDTLTVTYQVIVG